MSPAAIDFNFFRVAHQIMIVFAVDSLAVDTQMHIKSDISDFKVIILVGADAVAFMITRASRFIFIQSGIAFNLDSAPRTESIVPENTRIDSAF